MARRKYSGEYKRESVALTLEPGVTQAQVAGELGISASLLGRWVRAFLESGEKAFPG